MKPFKRTFIAKIEQGMFYSPDEMKYYYHVRLYFMGEFYDGMQAYTERQKNTTPIYDELEKKCRAFICKKRRREYRIRGRIIGPNGLLGANNATG